jgi:Fur family ferric uptake transcriptional regulator
MSHHLEAAQRLRKQGYRLTPQRLAVLGVIKAGPGHMSVNDVLARVRLQYPTLTVPTVYRILQWLKGANVVAETDLGADCHLYEYIADHHHHHLVCVRCQRVIDLPHSFLDSVSDQLRREYGFVPCLEHVGLFGVCPQCQVDEPGVAKGPSAEGEDEGPA